MSLPTITTAEVQTTQGIVWLWTCSHPIVLILWKNEIINIWNLGKSPKFLSTTQNSNHYNKISQKFNKFDFRSRMKCNKKEVKTKSAQINRRKWG